MTQDRDLELRCIDRHSTPFQMKPLLACLPSSLLAALLIPALPLLAADKSGPSEPKIVPPGPPPADAIVLFDGTDLNQWRGQGGDAQWKLEAGAMVVNGTGNLFTRQEFGDCQLHIEWATPAKVEGDGQGRGNSGVYFQGRYEIQILDSYQNPTQPDGQAGAFYGHNPPLVNASRPPGEWQVYQIIFRAPKQAANGSIQPGSFTVLHNGVLIQDQIPIPGQPTAAAAFRSIAEKGPLMLQDHGNPVRFRNIWLRPL
jgi:hypothetical protein